MEQLSEFVINHWILVTRVLRSSGYSHRESAQRQQRRIAAGGRDADESK